MNILFDEPLLRDEIWNRKRPCLSEIPEEQDSIMFDEASQSKARNQSVAMKDLPSAIGPSFFHDASHINVTRSFISAIGGDQHINVNTKT